ncbi:multidrug MFS transporter [Niastella yeongjuensis]|uniref:Multidrug MFS transporter n=1 Tax=Niastella yeongjuensis TaxID=354355 RepID=A0A1V9E4Z1_9BACT|nr:epoxide hydrolase [Niastella yeongjuensis]OQP40985.1 multidrug MFS transporter [Niastella yeongjuensis]SEO95722.1 Pimeloyl-ACP methyl ester carboxylesterase [Niastella yeongjuensis]
MSTSQTSAVPKMASSESLRPFQFLVPQSELEDLMRRVKATRWPEKETVNDASQGVPLATMQKVAGYWTSGYDWRKIENRINSFPNFITEIDGLDIHFMHIKSKHANAMPVIITHGWPGSVIEQMKLIEPLTDPTKYGGKEEDAFDVVIPSMPGYGFSGKPTTTGWGPERIASAWTVLMKRLGYNRYVAQGGDWGAIITDLMGVQADPALAAIHLNMPGAVPPEIDKQCWAGTVPAGLPADETKACQELVDFYKVVYYAFFMGTRPETLTGISDSPIGLASLLLDHDPKSTALIARSFDGKSEGISKDDVLDNVSLFWFTNTGISAARLYWENKLNFFAPKGVKIPVGVSVFPDELYPCPRSWAEKAYPKLMHFNIMEKGGHFAAFEQPKSLVQEMRTAFKSLR